LKHILLLIRIKLVFYDKSMTPTLQKCVGNGLKYTIGKIAHGNQPNYGLPVQTTKSCYLFCVGGQSRDIMVSR